MAIAARNQELTQLKNHQLAALLGRKALAHEAMAREAAIVELLCREFGEDAALTFLENVRDERLAPQEP